MAKQSGSDLSVRIRQKIERVLGAAASGDNLQPLSSFSENLLLQVASGEILEELAAVAKRKNISFVANDQETFQWGTSVYELRVGLAPQSGRSLEVVVGPTRRYEPTLMGQIHHVDGLGRVREFRVLLANIFEPQREWIERSVKMTFEIGYRSLKSYLQDGVEDTQQAPAHALYSHVRSALPHELASSVKLNAIVENEGIYLFDREAFSGSVQAAEATNFLTSKSPLEVVVNVCTTLVPFDLMFSKEALTSGTVIEANLFNAKYRSDGNLTHILEMALYGSHTASVQPLVKTDNTCLVAAYPAAFRRKIEPLLAAETKKFENIISQQSKGLRTTLNRITEQNKKPVTAWLETGAGMLGAFTGVGVAEFIRHMR